MVWPDAASFSSSSVGDALPCVLYERRCGGAGAARWDAVAVLAAALCPQLAASVTVFVVIRAASTTTEVAAVARRRSPSLLPSSILKQNLYSIRAEMMRKESPWLGLRIVYLGLGNGRRIKAN